MLPLVEIFYLIQLLAAMAYARTRVDSVLELAFQKSVLATILQRLKKESRRYLHGVVWQHSHANTSGSRFLR